MRFDYCEECDTQHVDQCHCDHNQWYWDELEQDCEDGADNDGDGEADSLYGIMTGSAGAVEECCEAFA